MCGIAGWFTWSDQRLSKNRIARLWIENEFRGKDAAGVAYLQDQKLMYLKQRGRASELIRSIDDRTWENIVRSPYGLLHTRAATQGSPATNENNHPVVANDWAVVHNGIIWNDDPLFEHFKVTRPAEVDSAAINLVLGQGASVEESLPHVCTLRGSASVAAAHAYRPGEIVLFRLSGPPVHLYWLPSISTLVWSSDADGHKAIEDLPDNGFAGLMQAYAMPDNTAFHLTQTGLKRYALTPRPYGPSYRTVSRGGTTGFLPRGTAGRRLGRLPTTLPLVVRAARKAVSLVIASLAALRATRRTPS